MAAGQGSSDAALNLGGMYDSGEGVEQDYKQAVSWWTKAAEKGHAVAQNNLGLMYAQGLGVNQDYVEAYKWFTLSSMGGEESALSGLGTAESLMTEEEIAEAKELVNDWKSSH